MDEQEQIPTEGAPREEAVLVTCPVAAFGRLKKILDSYNAVIERGRTMRSGEKLRKRRTARLFRLDDDPRHPKIVFIEEPDTATYIRGKPFIPVPVPDSPL